jgi:hypothetical protein
MIAANSISMLADLLSKVDNSKTTYLISTILKNLSNVANPKVDEHQRKSDAQIVEEQLNSLLHSGAIPKDSIAELDALHESLSTELANG